MRHLSADELRDLALDIETELSHLERLGDEIRQVQTEIARDPAHAPIFYESQALKLHNFYTGCEHVFHLVASDLNGTAPAGFDWHKRLLDRMGCEREDRPALLLPDTVQALREYLAFRHVVHNIYGFELDPGRIDHLVERHSYAWRQFEADIRRFTAWLCALADDLGTSSY